MQAFFCRILANDFNPCVCALASDSRTLKECFPSAEFHDSSYFRVGAVGSRITYKMYIRKDGRRKVLIACRAFTGFEFSEKYIPFVISERFFNFNCGLVGVKLI